VTRRTRKILFVTVKLIVAAALLTWVFSQVHWHDYAVSKADGESHAVEQVLGPANAPESLVVSDGMLWWRTDPKTRPTDEFEPIEGGQTREVIRRGVRTSLATINRALLLIALSLHFLISFAQALRWWLLLKVQEIPATLPQTTRVTFVGLFFNLLMPGTFGGDLLRAYFMAKNSDKKEAVVLSLFVERALGLTELGMLSAIMLVVALIGGLSSAAELQTPAICIVVLLTITIGTLCVLLSPRLRKLLRLSKLYGRLPLADRFRALGRAARTYRRHPGTLAVVLAICLTMHVCMVTSILLLGRALAIDIPWYNYFIFIPLIYIIGSVPITPGGVGLIEKLYLTFFVLVNPSALLVLALLARLMPVVAALPGLPLFFLGPHPKLGKIEQEIKSIDG